MNGRILGFTVWSCVKVGRSLLTLTLFTSLVLCVVLSHFTSSSFCELQIIHTMSVRSFPLLFIAVWMMQIAALGILIGVVRSWCVSWIWAVEGSLLWNSDSEFEKKVVNVNCKQEQWRKTANSRSAVIGFGSWWVCLPVPRHVFFARTAVRRRRLLGIERRRVQASKVFLAPGWSEEFRNTSLSLYTHSSQKWSSLLFCYIPVDHYFHPLMVSVIHVPMFDWFCLSKWWNSNFPEISPFSLWKCDCRCCAPLTTVHCNTIRSEFLPVLTDGHLIQIMKVGKENHRVG